MKTKERSLISLTDKDVFKSNLIKNVILLLMLFSICSTANSITYSLSPGITSTSAKNLILGGNTISSPDNSFCRSWLPMDFDHEEDPSREIFTENAEDTTTTAGTIMVRARVITGTTDTLELMLDDSTVKSWTVSDNSFAEYPYTGDYNGENIKTYFQGNGNAHIEIDYLMVDSTIYQAEDQETNTSVWQNDSCGGSYSEKMQCPGYIDFGSISTEGNHNFEESNGLLTIEAESLTLTESWTIGDSISGASGGEYIYWTGDQYFGDASNGHIDVNIIINNPGTYAFDWKVAIGYGNSYTEHNDSWLKVNGSDFYGYQKTRDHYIHPRPLCHTSDYDCPEGGTTDGFFKLFGGSLKSFQWKAHTSDNDDHLIYVDFDQPGEYTFTIAARSSYHCIDVMKFTKIEGLGTSSNMQNVFQPLYSVKTYPNPSQGLIHVSTSGLKGKSWKVLNSVGHEIKKGVIEKDLFELNIQQKGIYFFIVNEEEAKFSKVVLIE